jgi:hypothetical protein
MMMITIQTKKKEIKVREERREKKRVMNDENWTKEQPHQWIHCSSRFNLSKKQTSTKFSLAAHEIHERDAFLGEILRY